MRPFGTFHDKFLCDSLRRGRLVALSIIVAPPRNTNRLVQLVPDLFERVLRKSLRSLLKFVQPGAPPCKR